VDSMCGGRLVIVCVRSYLNTCKGYLLLLGIEGSGGGKSCSIVVTKTRLT
jgi:hypothetical protein